MIVGLVIAMVIGLQLIGGQLFAGGEGVSMAELAQMVREGKVDTITVRGDDLAISLDDGRVMRTRKEAGTSVYETLNLLEVPAEALNDVDITVVGPGISSMLGSALFTLVPLLIIGWFAFSMLRSCAATRTRR